jgi:hypothetical protein
MRLERSWKVPAIDCAPVVYVLARVWKGPRTKVSAQLRLVLFFLSARNRFVEKQTDVDVLVLLKFVTDLGFEALCRRTLRVSSSLLLPRFQYQRLTRLTE